MSPTAKKSTAQKAAHAAQAVNASAPTPAAHAPLRVTDTSLRDAHQSLWATRMRTSDIIKIGARPVFSHPLPQGLGVKSA